VGVWDDRGDHRAVVVGMAGAADFGTTEGIG